MSWSETLNILQALPADERGPWLTGVICVALAMAVALYVESLFFRRSDRVGTWLAVRVGSVLAAPLAFAVVVLPARATSGMEGLAVFYGLLFTVGPLVWFGYHALAGRIIRPGLRPGEGIALGISGLAILAIPATAFVSAQSELPGTARDLAARGLPARQGDPLPHAFKPLKRHALPDGAAVYSQTLVAPAGLRLERIERRVAGQWHASLGSERTYCLAGADVHLLWSSLEDPPFLRLHWRGDDGRAAHGEFTPDPAQAVSASEPFAVRFIDGNVEADSPVPRARVSVVLRRPDGSTYLTGLGSADKGEPDCVGLTSQPAPWRAGIQPQTLTVTFIPPAGSQRRAVWQREAASEAGR